MEEPGDTRNPLEEANLPSLSARNMKFLLDVATSNFWSPMEATLAMEFVLIIRFEYTSCRRGKYIEKY